MPSTATIKPDRIEVSLDDDDLDLLYADDGEESDSNIFDCMDVDPCHHSPDYQHRFIGKCGETRCRHCKRIVG